MDILKQLEAKLHALVQQRNTLKDELDNIKVAKEILEQDLAVMRSKAEGLQEEKAVLLHERDEMRAQVEYIIMSIEEVA